MIKSWPEKCPYEEIYKARGKWYGLFREEWINPAGLNTAGILQTLDHLDEAKKFHEDIENTYHENSYAHYGADTERKAWHKVVWKTTAATVFQDVEALSIVGDDQKGELKLVDKAAEVEKSGQKVIDADMQAAAEPGDQTVPLHSGDAQLRSGKFKGIFRQSGYEHQASYDDKAVIDATLYSLFKIISTMKWSER